MGAASRDGARSDVHHEPIPEGAPNGPSDLEDIWWPTPSRNGAVKSPPRQTSRLDGVVDRGGEAPAEEIWGTPGLVRAGMPRGPEELTPEDIWGSLLHVAGPNVPPAESIWGGLAEVATPPPVPPPAHRRPFALPDAWAASSGRPRWRRLGAFRRLSRRTG